MVKALLAVLEQEEGRAIVRRLCRESNIDVDVLEELVEEEMNQIGKMKKKGMWDKFDDILDRIKEQDECTSED